MRNDSATSLQELSASVSPAGNGCREDSSWLPRKPVNETAVAIRKARGLANDWRKAHRFANDWRKHAEPANGYRLYASARAIFSKKLL